MSIVLLTLAAAAATAPLSPTRCDRPTSQRVDTPVSANVRPLGEMPPARQILGVLRILDRCPTPIVVREQVGQPNPTPPAVVETFRLPPPARHLTRD